MISIIIPCYNEAQDLERLINKVSLAMSSLARRYEIIVVDDGSTDKSVEVLKKITSNKSFLKTVVLRRNYGQTAAMMAGIDYSTGDIIIPLDADLQNDPDDIPSLLAKIDEGFDVVSGWRKNRRDNAIKRNFPSFVANKLISWISGLHLNDYGCSLKAYRREVIKDVRLYGEMHRFIPIYASWLGAKVTEIPVSHHPRVHGSSKYGLERSIKVILDLIVVKFLASFAHKPIYLFGGFGFLALVTAFCVGLYTLWLKIFEAVSFIETPLPLLVVMLSIFGFVSILMGLIAELVMRTYYESQSKNIYLVREEVNCQKKPRINDL
jgi:glycosyltransferase involved in cell wall biosynthesis